ncbi:MAG: sigma-70 family RNA polymerase sigma factor [Bacteroidetes bacterium]|nr:sigma-70 family RNA polymerase sigma factor [Bacteroidota bacterium]
MRNLKITKQITNRAGKSMEIYLKDVSREPMVSPQEEVELSRLIQAGDTEALRRLINGNLRFVISVAKQYQHTGIPLEDLINEGNIGLITAAKRFDATRGFKFISYAVWWIRQSILKAISEKSRRIRVPANKTRDTRSIAEAAMSIEQHQERTASPEEIAEILGMDVRDVKQLLQYTQKELSIDSAINSDDDARSMLDVMVDESSPDPELQLLDYSLTQEIDQALAGIDQKDAYILSLFYGLKDNYPKTLADIGKKLGISSESVRKRRDRALRNLKRQAKDDLKSYL